MIFETENDLLNEVDIIKKIAGKNEFKKLDRFGLDYEIIGKAFIEIKKYKSNFDAYQNIIVSCIKLVKMQEASKFLPTYLFIQYFLYLHRFYLYDIHPTNAVHCSSE